jgi:hypothetical protein
MAPLLVMFAIAVVAGTPNAQSPSGTPVKNDNTELELIQRLHMMRKDYQKALENVRIYYHNVGDVEKRKWAEEELRKYHRIPKQAFILALVVPPPNLQGHTNIPEANKLLTWAITYKDKGWGDDYIDNQRRAEILLNDLLSKYPQSDKISDAAFHLGDIYESKAYKQFRLSAEFYVRCYQWNPKTHFDARLRAARLFDYEVKDRAKAIELYREITTHETDPKRIQEATKRLGELSSAPPR